MDYLNLLILWVESHLKFATRSSDPAVLGDQWRELTHGQNPWAEIAPAWQALCRKVGEGLLFFRGSDSVVFAPDDDSETAEKLQMFLGAFDRLVLLYIGLVELPFDKRPPQDLVSDVESWFSRVTCEEAPAGVRLIPFNKWRNEMLTRIPEEKRYLFPWYEHLADVPEQALSVLVEHWHEIKAGQFCDTEEIDAGTMRAVWAEVQVDDALHRDLEDLVRLDEAFGVVADRTIAYRLAALVIEPVEELPFPEALRQKGLVAVTRIALGEPIRSEEERTERLFLAGFCGPYLSDVERLALFAEVEERLPEQKTDGILGAIRIWQAREVTDAAFYHLVWTRWQELLLGTADRVAPVEVAEETAEAFLATVELLRAARVETN